jgi:hypothetical protein
VIERAVVLALASWDVRLRKELEMMENYRYSVATRSAACLSIVGGSSC